ncbi:MAG: threonine synthase [Endomicrobium sp.]|jgi:threonine synthase|nr:threonine synthase [Endomicrobium sp.]
MVYQGLIEKYKDFLPVNNRTPIISLYEGNTPLIPANNLLKKLRFDGKIYFKFEGMNPTGSFKDRGMTIAVSKAVENGSKAVICASTGNTAASAAAYAAKAGIQCVVLIPEGKIAMGKLSQAVIHGAEVLSVDGNFDETLNLVRELSGQYPVTLVNSINPFRIDGQKTAAYEICESLGQSPDYQFMPVGNAGNITAYWKGYKEYAEAEPKKYSLPKMMGFQASGSAPLVEGYPILNPETIATAIRIGNPVSWKYAEEARDESGGIIDKVTDDEILNAYTLIAETEGIFCEPASAASIAGLIKCIRHEYFDKLNPVKIVCILTGHGLKDPDTVLANAVKLKKIKSVKADIKDIISAVEL